MPPSSGEPPSHRFPFESGDRLPLRADVVDLLRRAGVEFFRIPIAPEGEAMKAYFLSPAYIHCHFTPTWVAEEGSALTLLKVFISKVHPEEREHMTAVARILLSSEGYSSDITSNRFRGVSEIGQWCWYEVRMSVRREGDLRICEGLMINVEEQEEARQTLERVAFEDRLTGLGNLAATVRSVERLIGAPAYEGEPSQAELPADPFAIIWLDLAGFGRVNSLLGRSKGDDLLISTAQILRDWSQEGDLVTRPNSDEFVIVLPGRDSEAALAAARHLQQMLPMRMRGIGDLERGLGFQAGISAYPHNGLDAETLLGYAAAALDQAARLGGDSLVVYSETLTSAGREVLALEQGLQQAIALGQLSLVFQPQVGAAGELLGCEALLRWQSPDLGAVSPGRFIPLAEETGQIHTLGAWVIEEACRLQSRWQEAGLQPPPLAINVSAVQLTDDRLSLAAHLLRCLELYHLNPASLHVEITESGALEEHGIGQLMAIHEAGVALEIDDFGTGFASLSSLLRLPIHGLKLDQSFVREMDSSEASVAILRASLALAGSIGAQALVEGVEEAWQAEQLRGLGFSRFQGYLFSRPLAAEGYETLLRERPNLGPGAPEGAVAVETAAAAE